MLFLSPSQQDNRMYSIRFETSDCLRAGIPANYVNSALHPFGVAKLNTGSIWDKGGSVTSAGWQVTL